MDSAMAVPHAVYASKKVPFTHIRKLGQGAFAIVDEVKPPRWTKELGHNFDGRTFARKVLKVSRRQRKEEIQAELEIAVKLRHQHLVQVLMTYEETLENPWERQTFGMIMNPVAQCTLQQWMDEAEAGGDATTIGCIIRWFGCLASGLACLHEHRIRHKDIKPANILVWDDCVLLSDFGVAKFIAPEVADTQTEGPPGRLTYKYAAPEVIAHDFRGRKADVFSLGCVFAEMLAVLHSRSRREFEAFRGPPGQQAFYESLDRTLRWLLPQRKHGHACLEFCCAAMVPDPEKRISSRDLARWIMCDWRLRYDPHVGLNCQCLGPETEPAGKFRTVSLGKGPCEPPYADAQSEDTEISWRRALDYWFDACEWDQDTPRAVPRLLSVTPPTLIPESTVDATSFWSVYGV